MEIKKIVVILIHAFIIWILCALTVFVGMSVTTELITLTIHAILAPIFAFIVSIVYFKKFNYTSPILTAIIFIVLIIVMDFFLVALIILQSFEIFTSFIGTWLPFMLIFLSTYLTGRYLKKKNING